LSFPVQEVGNLSWSTYFYPQIALIRTFLVESTKAKPFLQNRSFIFLIFVESKPKHILIVPFSEGDLVCSEAQLRKKN